MLSSAQPKEVRVTGAASLMLLPHAKPLEEHPLLQQLELHLSVSFHLVSRRKGQEEPLGFAAQRKHHGSAFSPSVSKGK